MSSPAVLLFSQAVPPIRVKNTQHRDTKNPTLMTVSCWLINRQGKRNYRSGKDRGKAGAVRQEDQSLALQYQLLFAGEAFHLVIFYCGKKD
ncbi:hypothetical protein CEXT_730951 [Caerostris extrusa]|uniref:Uncharacterized protein n=1 Tax=Caerostris extrusa TaxID=172846 RepID=A0AAV4MNA1_CAEEX|nr:hypothetical protein CEXT_730951 [Caerostris extrusa]